MAKLISEAIEPIPGTFDAGAMSRGEPGLPTGFTWRGRTLKIAGCERKWGQLGVESGGSEMYRRRHYFDLRMEDGGRWIVYCLRQPPKSGSPSRRWFLYSID